MKALALISGGLDSMLAAHLVKAQGIEVIGVYCTIPFCSRETADAGGCPGYLRRCADTLGVALRVVSLGEDFLKILKHPSHGYGGGMNPCIDCRILMLSKCREMMKREGASFVVTGEVLGQRPMSQHKDALGRIERDCGLTGLLVRPLSARMLQESIPEREGWISREGLLALNGRGRRSQLELADRLNLREYRPPAGGCLLTERLFSRKVRDLMDHEALSCDNLELLKVGRHFRLSAHCKLVVGRDEQEDIRLASCALPGDHLFFPPVDIAGASALGKGSFDEDARTLAGGILSRYFDLGGARRCDILWMSPPGKKETRLQVEVLSDGAIEPYRI